MFHRNSYRFGMTWWQNCHLWIGIFPFKHLGRLEKDKLYCILLNKAIFYYDVFTHRGTVHYCFCKKRKTQRQKHILPPSRTFCAELLMSGGTGTLTKEWREYNFLLCCCLGVLDAIILCVRGELWCRLDSEVMFFMVECHWITMNVGLQQIFKKYVVTCWVLVEDIRRTVSAC